MNSVIQFCSACPLYMLVSFCIVLNCLTVSMKLNVHMLFYDLLLHETLYMSSPISPTHTHIHANTHTHTHTNMQTHKHANTHTHKHTHTQTHTHANTHTHMRTQTHTHANTHTCKHTHTHTHTFVAVELNYGNVYCVDCADFIYHMDFDKVAMEVDHQLKVTHKPNGTTRYLIWEPTLAEIEFLRENSKRRKIDANSSTGVYPPWHIMPMNHFVQVPPVFTDPSTHIMLMYVRISLVIPQ